MWSGASFDMAYTKKDAVIAARYHAKNRKKRNESCRSYHEKNREAVLARKREYYKNNKDKEKLRNKTLRQKFLQKSKARDALNAAIRKKRIINPKQCSLCDSKKTIQAHHEDYSKPLEVIWVCATCHARIHAHKKREENELRKT